MKISVCVLLCIIFSYSICSANSTNLKAENDIQELANRLALLEQILLQEHHNGYNPNHPPIPLTYGFLNSRDESVIQNFQRRLQILEDKLFQHEKDSDDKNHYNKRIQFLETELSTVVKQQVNDASHIEKLQMMVTDQLNSISELKEEMFHKKKTGTATLLPDVIGTKQDEVDTADEVTKVLNNKKTKNAIFSRSTHPKRDPRESNLIKKRLPSHTVTTTSPHLPHTANIIAFYAYISAITPVITDQRTLVYDVVKANNGNGYNPTTGVFVAPETGVYVFTWTIREASNCYHSTQLMVNAAEMGIIHLHSVVDGDFSATGIVVTHVNAGDDVYVRTHESWNHCFIVSNDAGKSSFAGWKLS